MGPDYECHSCGRTFSAGLVRVPRAWGAGGRCGMWIDSTVAAGLLFDAKQSQETRQLEVRRWEEAYLREGRLTNCVNAPSLTAGAEEWPGA